MKISSKKCKFDAKFIFLQLANFVLTTFLHLQVSVEISFSKKLENDILKENSKLKKVIYSNKLSISKANLITNQRIYFLTRSQIYVHKLIN